MRIIFEHKLIKLIINYLLILDYNKLLEYFYSFFNSAVQSKYHTNNICILYKYKVPNVWDF